MRILVAYNCYAEGVDRYCERCWEQLRAQGHEVRGFCLTLDPPGPWKRFAQLEREWRAGDRRLLRHLSGLEQLLRDRDVLVNWNGSDLPPEFVHQLPVHTVFICGDDPESSHELSQPAAWAYDQAFVRNVAAVPLYAGWGCPRAEFLPFMFAPWDLHPGLTAETLALEKRDIDVVFFGERETPWRRDRLDRLAHAFPQGVFRGAGWPGGYVPEKEMLSTYARAKIGINVHNSTGPINIRLYQLPAHGVMQICDCRSHLNAVFEDGREIVGFEKIEECIELVRYYLVHDDERIRIARAGFARAHRDYALPVVWRRLEGRIAAALSEPPGDRPRIQNIAIAQRARTVFRQPAWLLCKPFWLLRKAAGPLARRALNVWRRR